ncbi:hypothetical protein [Pontimicrobium sp. MEBiC06410]
MSSVISHTIQFNNKTKDAWTFCIYQQLPNTIDLDSVSWKQERTAPSGEALIKWDVTYLVGLAKYNKEKNVYTPTQKKETNLGKEWICENKDAVLQLIAGGETNASNILIRNRSGEIANLATGMDNSITVVKREVYSGLNIPFTIAPKYYVALFTNLVEGEVIFDNQICGPLEVVFANGQTSKVYEARVEGANFILEEVGTVNRIIVSHKEVQSRKMSKA